MQPTPDYSFNQKTSKIPLVIVSLLLVLALAFGIWAFGGRQDYKNNVDKKIAVAIAAAKKDQAAQLQAQFDEQSKSPYKTFNGSATYGSVSFQYPKTWSAYVNSDSNQPVNAYFFPGEVPGTDSQIAYPLRVELVNTDYSQVLQQFTSQISQGNLKASAYIPPKMKDKTNVLPGTRFDGAIGQSGNNDIVGSLVVIKVRDKTLQISAQTQAAVKDFDNIILPSLTFVP
jgi:hypothetical protein